jgi:hypothetical protein
MSFNDISTTTVNSPSLNDMSQSDLPETTHHS